MIFSVSCVRGDKKTEIYSQHSSTFNSRNLSRRVQEQIQISPHTRKTVFQISAVGCKTSSEIIVRASEAWNRASI